MGKYTLFHREITLAESAERFFDIQKSAWDAMDAATTEFKTWYENCRDIASVLKGYLAYASSLTVQNAMSSLFEQLTHLDIYDISITRYEEQCFDSSAADAAYNQIVAQYNAIVGEQEAAMEYRAERKASRGRVVGGGYGVSGSLKGMATAGAMNAVAGAGHSVFNAIGNAASAIEASSAKRALYNSTATYDQLLAGIRSDILTVFNNHIALVNERKGSYIHSTFDSEKASALLENAKKVPEKQEQLLQDAFRNCPWSKKLLTYIFITFPTERKNVWLAAQRFSVDLHQVAESVFEEMYTDRASNVESVALDIKAQITALMAELGIEQSSTLDTLEKDCIRRLLEQYNNANGAELNAILDNVKQYDARAANKADVIHELGVWELAAQYGVSFSAQEAEQILSNIYTGKAKEDEAEALLAKQRMVEIMCALNVQDSLAFDQLEKDCIQRLCPQITSSDELTCNQMISAISAYDALPKNKQPYLDEIKKRIEEIWSAEDFVRFVELYKGISSQDPTQAQNLLALVEETGRTADKKVFVDALSVFSVENIKTAAKYIIAKEKGGLASLGALGKEGLYKKLTCGGVFVHSDIDKMVAELKQEKEAAKGKGFFAAFAKKKASSMSPDLKNDAAKFCTNCGAKLDSDAQFCTMCGYKQG